MFWFFKNKKKDQITELRDRAINNINEAYQIRRDATQKLDVLFASDGNRETIAGLLDIVSIMDKHIRTKDNKANHL